MRVLVPNLGSTSLKYQLLEMEDQKVLTRGKIERIGSEQALITTWNAQGEASKSTAAIPNHRAAIQRLIDHLNPAMRDGRHASAIDAVGFKAVHAGPDYRGSFLIDNELLAAMQEFVSVAPVHNPVYLEAMQVFREILPGVPMVAVFETGFHATIPERAYVYGVPYEWLEKYGVRRYGFHGSSHRYVSRRAPEVLGRPAADLRLISCHLGGTSSITAIANGKSVDTTLGFSPQSGLEHAARHGELDPFAVLYVMQKENLSVGQISALLCKKSGLLGISGVSSDVRDLEEEAAKGHHRAALALDVFIYEIKKYIGAYAAAMGGLEAVAFAGGIGENSQRVRAGVCQDLEFLGLHLDLEKNQAAGASDRIISRADSPVAILVIYTNEELMVAEETVRVLAETRGR